MRLLPEMRNNKRLLIKKTFKYKGVYLKASLDAIIVKTAIQGKLIINK